MTIVQPALAMGGSMTGGIAIGFRGQVNIPRDSED